MLSFLLIFWTSGSVKGFTVAQDGNVNTSLKIVLAILSASDYYGRYILKEINKSYSGDYISVNT